MAVTTAPARSSEPGRPGRRPGPGRRTGLDRALPWLLLLPAAITLGLVSIYPIYAGVHASLTTYLYGRPVAGAGLKNYTDTWHDPVFWQAMETTLKFVLIAVIAETVLGLATKFVGDLLRLLPPRCGPSISAVRLAGHEPLIVW